MFKKKEFIGVSLEGETLKIAHVVSDKKKLRLVRMDQLTLVEPIKKPQDRQSVESDMQDDLFDAEQDADLIFGLDDEETANENELAEDDADDTEDFEDEIFGDLDLDSFEEDDDDFIHDADDLIAESSDSFTNKSVIRDYLSSVTNDRKVIAVNVPAGETVFQFLDEMNYSDVKKKELLEIIEDKLRAVYDREPTEDLYDFNIRDDGTLIIGSLDSPSPALDLVFEYGQKQNQDYTIADVTPDESIMMGMYRTHYRMDDEIVTALLQIGEKKSRLLFMRGSKLLQVSPVINEGFANKNYLNTIFSKILFQIDTGEVPALDQLIIFNNGKGVKVLDFFRSSFSELIVEEFEFNRDILEYDESQSGTVSVYSTAIGLACVAANNEVESNIDLSFLPSYVIDQQKIFKLQWHGIAILVLIGLAPIFLNYLYQQNQAEIKSLQNESSQLQTMIGNLEPLVQRSDNLTQELATMDEQLTLLTDLNRDNIRWTVTMDLFNRAVQNTGNTWITSFRQDEDVLLVDGFSMYKSRIPTLASQFEEVTLLNVRKQEMRERDIFAFSMMIRNVVADSSAFTPSYTSGNEQQLAINP